MYFTGWQNNIKNYHCIIFIKSLSPDTPRQSSQTRCVCNLDFVTHDLHHWKRVSHNLKQTFVIIIYHVYGRSKTNFNENTMKYCNEMWFTCISCYFSYSSKWFSAHNYCHSDKLPTVSMKQGIYMNKYVFNIWESKNFFLKQMAKRGCEKYTSNASSYNIGIVRFISYFMSLSMNICFVVALHTCTNSFFLIDALTK